MTEPLLNYAIGPKKLQVGSTDVTLQIMISPKVVKVDESSNPWDGDGSGRDIYLKDITVSLDIGDGSADLTKNPEIKQSDPIGWNLVNGRWKFGALTGWTISRTSDTGGEFVFTADTPVKMEANSLILLNLSGIEINNRGTTTVHITENTCSDPQGADFRTGATVEDLEKVDEFHVGQIWPNHQHIEHGGGVTLNWLSSDGAVCSLHWKQNGTWEEKSNLPHSSALCDGGAFSVDDLTEDTTFILRTDSQSKEARPDDCTVYVMDPIPKINDFSGTWQENADLLLEWDTLFYEQVIISNLPGLKGVEMNKSPGKHNHPFSPSVEHPLPKSFVLSGTKKGRKKPDTRELVISPLVRSFQVRTRGAATSHQLNPNALLSSIRRQLDLSTRRFQFVHFDAELGHKVIIEFGAEKSILLKEIAFPGDLVVLARVDRQDPDYIGTAVERFHDHKLSVSVGANREDQQNRHNRHPTLMLEGVKPTNPDSPAVPGDVFICQKGMTIQLNISSWANPGFAFLVQLSGSTVGPLYITSDDKKPHQQYTMLNRFDHGERIQIAGSESRYPNDLKVAVKTWSVTSWHRPEPRSASSQRFSTISNIVENKNDVFGEVTFYLFTESSGTGPVMHIRNSPEP